MYRVLVVEDDADINAILQESLRLAGYDVMGVLTGAAAMAEVERRCPDLILLDQMLPDLDGLELCRLLRGEPRTARVPIIFLTARATEAERVRGLSSGADDYVTKPFSMRELMLRVEALLRRASALPQIRLAPAWLQCREQFRVWDSYAQIHLGRGGWQECRELCRSILNRCEEALSPAERCLLYSRLARCAQELGDPAEELRWKDKAHAEARLA